MLDTIRIAKSIDFYKRRLSMIQRKHYLDLLIQAKGNGFPKVITGIRRCGKSFLLNKIYHDYLISQGVMDSDIIQIELDDINNASYRNPLKLTSYVKEKVKDSNRYYYVFIDEIQLVTKIINPAFTNGKIIVAKETDENSLSFVDVVLGLSRLKNVDLYVTGSNSKLLSKDVVTEFRDKATNIHLYPLSFQEYYGYVGGDKYAAFYEYARYGGMPLCVLKNSAVEKENYLKQLFETTYLKDIIEHNKFRKSESLDEICNLIASCSGQLLNAQRVSNIFISRKKEKLSRETIDKYLEAFEDAYLIKEAKRYDIKGCSYIGATKKYYFSDIGLRNARLDFASLDMGQMIENIVYNELLVKGYQVKIGAFDQVEKNKENKSVLKSYEVDFIAHKGIDDFYLQVSDNIDLEITKKRELAPFKLIRDANRKYLIINKPISPMKLEGGIILDGVVDFILNLH